MTTQYRIQDISPSIRRECLAERTHIYVDWLALLAPPAPATPEPDRGGA